MKRRKSKLIAMAAITALPVVSAVGGTASASTYHAPAQAEATYEITYKNVSSGQYLTPVNFAAHNGEYRIFHRGQPATVGVAQLAENGDVPGLAAEMASLIGPNSINGVGGDGPIGPGEEVTFEITTSASRLSAASMIICTNDGFAALNSVRLPNRDGATRTRTLRNLDAGTEINTELRADLVPAPFCGEGEGTGESNPELAENGVVKRHRTLRGVGDLDPSLDWKGAVAEISITRVPSPASYSLTIENVTEGQYLTPPNVAAHTRHVDVFQRGQAASAPLAQLAENGDVAGLAAALSAAIDGTGNGFSGVAGDGPIAPGASVEFDFTSSANYLSLASMVICTNDGFAGIDTKRLPRHPGQSRTFMVRAYDAGSEINTELRADIVPAPFCGEGEGTGASNPALAENGVISRHPTQTGVGDLNPSLDWKGPVMKVTVTHN